MYMLPLSVSPDSRTHHQARLRLSRFSVIPAWFTHGSPSAGPRVLFYGANAHGSLPPAQIPAAFFGHALCSAAGQPCPPSLPLPWPSLPALPSTASLPCCVAGTCRSESPSDSSRMAAATDSRSGRWFGKAGHQSTSSKLCFQWKEEGMTRFPLPPALSPQQNLSLTAEDPNA